MGDQRGKLVLLTFLYTNCPDVCPLITQNLNEALQMLGAKRDDVRVLAVSVDPEGDTPSRLTSTRRPITSCPSSVTCSARETS